MDQPQTKIQMRIQIGGKRKRKC